jgi:hypothetical protein
MEGVVIWYGSWFTPKGESELRVKNGELRITMWSLQFTLEE